MKKYLRKLKRSVGRKIPENIKSVIRRFIIIFFRPIKNPTIPVEELKIFELIKDDVSVVFDVGAREDLMFYDIKPDCSYHLFEPNKKAVAVLQQKIATLDHPDITVNEFGLSDRNEDDRVYYEISQSFIINPFNKDVDTGQRYSLRTLDDYVRSKNISHIDLLKIDTEGFDYNVILGGQQTIQSSVSYIQFEIWDSVQRFVDILQDHFDLYLMIEPRLQRAIIDEAVEFMTNEQKQKDYTKSIVPLDAAIIDLIERILEPMGYGGNIFAIRKGSKKTAHDITFDVSYN